MSNPVLLAVDDDPGVRAASSATCASTTTMTTSPTTVSTRSWPWTPAPAALDLIARLQGAPTAGGAGVVRRAHARHGRRRPAHQGARSDAGHQARAPDGVRRHGRGHSRRQQGAPRPVPHQALEPGRVVLAARRPAGDLACGGPPRAATHGALRRPLVEDVLRTARVPGSPSRAVPLPRHGDRRGSGGAARRDGRYRAARCRCWSPRRASDWSGRRPPTSRGTCTCRRVPNWRAITWWWWAPARPA